MIDMLPVGRRQKSTYAVTLLCGLAIAGAWFLPTVGQAQDVAIRVEAGSLAPDSASATRAMAEPLSAEQMEALITRKREIRESAAAAAVGRTAAQGPEALADVVGEPTSAGGSDASRFHGDPALLRLWQNRTNPPTLSQSTLGETSAVNNARQVMATGNFTHFEYSDNRGQTWAKAVFPAGPASAPTPCCDNDVIHDAGRGVTFMSALYINSTLQHGVVRIFVRRNMGIGYNCSYTIDPGAGVLPDYPHIGKSNDFLYLTLNNIGPGGQAQIRRYDIDKMADCVAVPYRIADLNDRATVGQRVVTPADGATNTQYFSWAENSSQIRIFSWPETSNGPTSVLRTISASDYTNPDCRGGALNNDFTDGLWSSIHGFNRRGAVGGGNVYFYWSVGTDKSHPDGHVHSAIFNESGLGLIGQPPMWFIRACNGMPMISTNNRGDLGISTVVGGRAGGSGAAAQAYIGISDDYASTLGFFPTVQRTAIGTHNRTDQRFGDYFGIHRHQPCGDSWTTANYALNGGTTVANVNSRYVEFGRGRDIGCIVEYYQTRVRNQ